MAATGDVWITATLKQWLAREAEEHGVAQEGLACMLLALGLSDESRTHQAVAMLKAYGLGGSTDIANKGW